MKRSGIARKPKKAKKKPAKPKSYPRNHKHWKKLADTELTRLTKGHPCEVCCSVNGTCGHHLIEKSRSGVHRHNIEENIVILCPSHHTMGNTLAAHSSSMAVVAAFIDWMREKKPEQAQWATDHCHDKGKIDYRASYERLKEMTWEEKPMKFS